MAKESLYTPQKAPIFRETFADEQTTRALGGVPTSVTYSNGVGSFNGTTSLINYALKLRGTYSVRIKFKSISSYTNYIMDARTSSGTGYIYSSSANTLGVSSGTVYVNGVATTTYNSSTLEIVVTGIAIVSPSVIRFFSDLSNTVLTTAEVELIEIYDYTLSAQEISNLYSNSRYKQLQYGSGVTEILNVDAKNGVIANKYSGQPLNLTNVASAWDFTNWGTSSSVIVNASSYTSTPGNGGVQKTSLVTIGKTYKITFTTALTGSTTNLQFYNYGASTLYKSTIGNGVTTITFTATDAGFYFYNQGAGTTTITNIVLQEVAPDITNTSVIPVRSGNIWAMDFRLASLSKLDCGNYNNLTGNLTIIAWYKASTTGGGLAGRIIDNGSLQIHSGGYFTRNGSTYVNFITAWKLGVYQQLVVTSTSTGVTNIYINGVLIGSANQSAGTPIAGTSNILVGNINNNGRTFDGALSGVRIINGILTEQEVSQLFSNERRNYNV